jgi:hypothetical protein
MMTLAGKAPPPSWKCGVDYVSLPQNSFEMGEVCVVSRSDGRHSLAVVVRDRGESRSGPHLAIAVEKRVDVFSCARFPTSLLARKRGRMGVSAGLTATPAGWERGVRTKLGTPLFNVAS